MDIESIDLEGMTEALEKGDEAAFLKAVTGAAGEPEVPEMPEDQGSTPTSEAEQSGAKEGASPDTSAAEKSDDGQAILMPSGKGTIPYSELKQARERAREATQQAELLKQQLEELQARMSSGAETVSGADAVDPVDGQIAELEAQAEKYSEEFPEVSDGFKKTAEMFKAMKAQMQELAHVANLTQRTVQEDRAKTVEEQVQEAIDSVPTLALWQSEHPDFFDAAAAMDKAVRALPEWQGRPMAERFEAVVKAVRALNPNAPESGAGKVEPPSEEVQSGAKPAAKAAETNAAPAQKPFTLSDVPGGMAVPKNQTEQLQDLTTNQLFKRFSEMTPDALNEYLAGLEM